MRHHYWEWPIASYLFLGGLGGGIYCVAAILHFFVFPGTPAVGEAMALPGAIALLALGLGCVLLVLELGQPLVFYRAFVKSTSIICWGARLLSVCLIFGFIWFVSYLPWGWVAFLEPARDVCLALAGISGFGIMLYTGIMLSSLKSHSFWATPALPVLFTISALSTACAAIALCAGGWPAVAVDPETLEAIGSLIHVVDIVLVIAEITVLLVMILSFAGAGNVTAHAVAIRWIKGKTAPTFWIGMVGCGLTLPLVCYIIGGVAAELVAPIFVLAGGLLLRFLIVYSDDRQELPGEDRYWSRLAKNDAQFLTAWKQGENLY